MGYGSGALNEQQLQDMKRNLVVHPINDMEYKREMNQIITDDPRGYMFRFRRATYSPAQQRARAVAFENREKLFQSASEQSFMEVNMGKLTMDSIKKSSWLLDQTVPDETAIDTQIDNATSKFGIERMSKSQKSKRGKKFNKKAEFQARMINTMGECNYQRENSIRRLMSEGIDGWIGSNEYGFTEDYDDLNYLSNIGDPENVDIVAPIMQDIAFLKVQQVGEIRVSDDPTVRDGTMLFEDLRQNTILMKKLADPATRNGVFADTIRAFDKLDLDKFNYDSDEEFAKNTGKNRFQLRYAELKAYSHVGKMLRILDEESKKGTGYKMPDDIEEGLDKLHRKVRLLQDILADYDNRVLLLQSPYYVLLASKDFDSISNDELIRRIGTTEDPYARTYMQLELERRTNTGFRKGKSASKLLKANTININNNLTKKDINDYREQNYHPKTIDERAAMTSLPFIVFAGGEKSEYADPEFREKVKKMHQDVNSRATVASWNTPSRDLTIENIPKTLYELAGAEDLYQTLLADQQTLENFRARVEPLSKMEMQSGFRQSQLITEEILKITTGKEYRTARDKFIADYLALEKKITTYREQNQ